MGALYRDRCYRVTADAVDAHFLGGGLQITPGATTYQTWYEKSSAGVWQIKRQTISSNGSVMNLPTVTATVPQFPSCDASAGLTDGIAVGWMVASAMVIAASLIALKRGAR